MQPYLGTEPSPQPSAQSPAPVVVGRWEDRRNLLLIAMGWAGLLVLLPPQHDYPIIDDWVYAGSVRDFLQTGHFTMPLISQTNLFGLALWGAAWCKLFGFSFTTPTYSTLLLSIAGLFAFYGIARAASV